MAGEATRGGLAVAEQYAAEHYCYSRLLTVNNVIEYND